MAGRDLHALVATAVEQKAVVEAWIIRLDIAGDPLYVWTGPRDITFAGTGDAALDGVEFKGVGAVQDIGDVVDGRGGSQSLTLKLAGVDLSQPLLRQVVFDKRRWLFKRAYVWLAILDMDYNVIGVPFRVKTGRMDQMPVGRGQNQESSIQVVIESHQSYGGDALDTKWSEQADIDPTDTSQKYVHWLANKTPVIGQSSGAAMAAATSGSVGRTVRLPGGINVNINNGRAVIAAY